MLPKIDIHRELSARGIDFSQSGENEVRIICPFHGGAAPRCDVNAVKQLFVCRSCGRAGDLISLLSRVSKQSRADTLAQLSLEYGDVSDKQIEPAVIEKAHQALASNASLLKALAHRSIDDEAIRKFRLGDIRGRISIPIKNAQGQFVNVRKHSVDKADTSKVINVRGRGKIRLFPIDQLKFDKILIVGGELKAIACASVLNSLGVGVITPSGGESNWHDKFNALFRDKTVYVCLDIDDAGVTAAEALCIALDNYATVHNVLLPLSIEEYPTGDPTDFLAIGGDLHLLLDNAEPWKPNLTVDVKKACVQLLLAESTKPEHALQRVELSAVASAVDSSPYLVPKCVTPKCDKSQPFCAICPVKVIDKGDDMTIDPESDGLVEMTATTKKARRDAIMSSLNVPKCKSIDFDVQSYYKVDDAIVTDDLNITNIVADKTRLNAIFIDGDPKLLETYKLFGKIVPHPKTQKVSMIVSKAEPIDSSLTTFKLDDPESLSVFQPDEWTVEAIETKFNEIYDEFEPHVTRIYKRRDMHILSDLTYHSCLFMRVGDMNVKAWVETLIVGDSSQGKSWVTSNLAEFYGLGEKVECKNATIAGLLGGLQKINDRWFVSWGVIPTHDKRLVILEELKGMPKNVFSKLTDMRSSGIAEIPKIERQRTHARTRIIAVSNPRSALPIASYSFGVEAIRELIINLEDIRRFDACMVIGESEVDSTLLQQGISVKRGDLVFNSKICRDLILWAWTRTSEQATLDGIWPYICEKSAELSNKFTERVPIVDKGSMKYKLGRMAIAAACRTFSTDDNKSVVVRRCHVDFVFNYLVRIYSTAVFGYDRFTDAIKAKEELRMPKKLMLTIAQLPNRDSFISSCLAASDIDAQDVSDWTGYDMGDAKGTMSVLVRSNALIRTGRMYRKTPKFIELLKRLEQEPTQMPAHIRDDAENF